MKLMAMIPAFNEEENIGKVICEIPRHIEAVDEIEVLVVDDGSCDKTKEQAVSAGADYVISHPMNMGLAIAFQHGIEESLKLGADIIVNIDADRQYNPQEIPKLIEPILKNKAGVVIGDRQISTLRGMRAMNKYGNLFGSFILRRLSGFNIIDASSGFRAYSREAALRMNIFFGHTYTHQTIIEAVNKHIPIAQVPIEFASRHNSNSRLIKNIFTHIRVSFFVILRTLLVYRALKTFFIVGSSFFGLGVFLGLRFLYYYFFFSSSGKVQSLILAAILILLGIIIIVLGLLADAISINRRIGEDILYRLKKEEYKEKNNL